tara:strand:- start:2562 stop:4004 length:1443 start_codon:yes stop_codon:yes gene_type:complete
MGYAAMLSRKSSNRAYLELHRGKWRVTVAVPKEHHAKLGTRLKRSLGTDSLSVANAIKLGVVQELKDIIARLKGKSQNEYAFVMREAARLRQEAAKLEERDTDSFREAVAERAYEIMGPPVALEFVDDPDGGQLIDIHESGRERLARTFRSTALGHSVPMDLHLKEYREKRLRVKKRTEGDLLRGIERLKNWCHANGLDDDVGSITSRAAKDFTEALAGEQKLAARTVKKYVSRLSQYWRYLMYKNYVPENPWLQVEVLVEDTDPGEQERAFTNAEMVTLLTGPAPQALRDVMMIGALSGARLDAIVDMKVGDTDLNCFRFKPQKKEKRYRYVPIHPDLAELVERRRLGKAPTDELFPEYPQNAKDSLRERSFKTSNHFTEYRRKVGVDMQIEGRRRSLVNFHSFRRWFSTRAEQAGVPEALISAVVGHKRGSITLDVYSEGPAIQAARECIEAVKLPPLDGSPIIEPMLVMSGKGTGTQ